MKKGEKMKAYLKLFLLIVVLFVVNSNEVRAQEAAKTEDNPNLITQACREVAGLFDAGSQLTDIQKDHMWDTKYKGKTFFWDLKLVEVQQRFLNSGYLAMFKCRNSKSFISDINIIFSEDQKDTVMELRKNQFYQVKGILKSFNVMGLNAFIIE